MAEFLLYLSDVTAARERKAQPVDCVALGTGEDYRVLGLELTAPLYRDYYWHGGPIDPVLAQVRRLATNRRDELTSRVLAELRVSSVEPWTKPVLEARVESDPKLRLLSQLEAMFERARDGDGTVAWSSD